MGGGFGRRGVQQLHQQRRPHLAIVQQQRIERFHTITLIGFECVERLVCLHTVPVDLLQQQFERILADVSAIIFEQRQFGQQRQQQQLEF